MHKRKEKAKILKALKCGSTSLAQRLVTKYNSILAQIRYWLNDLSRSITLFCSYNVKGGHYSLTRFLARSHILFPLFHSRFLFASLSLPYLVEINLNSLPLSLGRKYFKTIPICLGYIFCCLQNQLTCSRFLPKWSYWLSPKLTKYAAILKNWV